jgi:WD40 repeat protein
LVSDKDGLSQLWSPIWSPDGQKLAALGDKGVWIFTTQTLPEAPQLLPGQAVAVLGFTQDLADVAILRTNETIVTWDMKASLQLATLQGTGEPALLSPTGKLVASSNRAGTVRFWNTITGQLLPTL